MSTKQQEKSKIKHADKHQLQEPGRKPYHKPKLEKLGDLRSLTLGPSIGPPEDSSAGWPADTWM